MALRALLSCLQAMTPSRRAGPAAWWVTCWKVILRLWFGFEKYCNSAFIEKNILLEGLWDIKLLLHCFSGLFLVDSPLLEGCISQLVSQGVQVYGDRMGSPRSPPCPTTPWLVRTWLRHQTRSTKIPGDESTQLFSRGISCPTRTLACGVRCCSFHIHYGAWCGGKSHC